MNNIYVFWWQGIENAPDVIKVCYKSLLKNYDNNCQKIHLIDEKNLKDYVDIPQFIIEKCKKGKITITHLSDYIRSILLYENGGLWIDASVFVTKPINNKIFEKEIFLIKNPKSTTDDITSIWEPFLIGGKKNNLLFKFIVDFFLEYWMKEDDLITYLLIDHLFYIAYKENINIKNALDQAKSFFYPVDFFQKIINEKFDEKKYNEICNNEDFIKLTYKGKLKTNIENDLTYYGKMRKIYNV